MFASMKESWFFDVKVNRAAWSNSATRAAPLPGVSAEDCWLVQSCFYPSVSSAQVGNLGLLFMLLFFIYAALGVELFGKLGQ